MPILFVVKASRRRLYEALRRLVTRPGLVGVVLERRRRQRRVGSALPTVTERRGFSLRQPLDADSVRTWAGLGFLVAKVRVLPADRPVDGRRPVPPAGPVRTRRSGSPAGAGRRPGRARPR